MVSLHVDDAEIARHAWPVTCGSSGREAERWLSNPLPSPEVSARSRRRLAPGVPEASGTDLGHESVEEAARSRLQGILDREVRGERWSFVSVRITCPANGWCASESER